MTQPFVESCLDFEVAHLSMVMVWRLHYPEIPTLTVTSFVEQMEYPDMPAGQDLNHTATVRGPQHKLHKKQHSLAISTEF